MFLNARTETSTNKLRQITEHYIYYLFKWKTEKKKYEKSNIHLDHFEFYSM